METPAAPRPKSASTHQHSSTLRTPAAAALAPAPAATISTAQQPSSHITEHPQSSHNLVDISRTSTTTSVHAPPAAAKVAAGHTPGENAQSAATTPQVPAAPHQQAAPASSTNSTQMLKTPNHRPAPLLTPPSSSHHIPSSPSMADVSSPASHREVHPPQEGGASRRPHPDDMLQSPTPAVNERASSKRTASGTQRPNAVSSLTSSAKQLFPSGTHSEAPTSNSQQRISPPISSSRTILPDPQSTDIGTTAGGTERDAVLQDATAQRQRKRSSHRRKASTSSLSSHDDPERSRTPSPILGDAYPYAGAASRPGHVGAPMVGPSSEDIQSLLHDKKSAAEATSKPLNLADSSEITAIIAKVEEMDFRDEATSAGQGKELELARMVKKLGQHALDQDAYIQSMEESLHNTRVTAVSVISNLTATHAYELAQEKELRSRIEVELEGAQASARKLSSLLAKAQSKNEVLDRERAASVEEEMRWTASIPGTGPRKPSAAATAAANAATLALSPGNRARIPSAQMHPPSSPWPGGALNDPFTDDNHDTTPTKSENITGLGIMDTPNGTAHSEYTDVFDSPMSAIISERNKLAADKKYLRNRVRDAEAQLHRLENELKALRPLLVQGGTAKAWMNAGGLSAGAPSVPPTPSASHQTPGRGRRDRSRRRRLITMGDAEAEHLLLAARRLNNVRAQTGAVMPPYSETSPLKPAIHRFAPGERPRTPPPSRSAGAPRTPHSAMTATNKTPRSGNGKGRGGLMDSMMVNGGEDHLGLSTGSPQARNRSLFRGHQRVDSNVSNASFNGMDELLQAAQSVLTPRDRALQQGHVPHLGHRPGGSNSENYFPRMPPGSPASANILPPLDQSQAQDSPKRRRVSATAADHDRPSFLGSSPPQRYLDSLAGRPGAAAPSVLTNGSSRRLRVRTEGGDASASPHSSYQGLRGDVDEAGSTGLSALDLLADQAAASQNPSQSSEPSNSDGERRGDGFSSQEEGGGGTTADDESRDGSGPNKRRPRAGVSSIMAARARVSAAPLAYAHSIGPPSDYPGQRYPGPYQHGAPPTPSRSGHQLSSPLTPTHAHQSLPPLAEAYAPRGVSSAGHLGQGYMPSLPPLSTALHGSAPPPHGYPGMQMHPMPASPQRAGQHLVQHGHHQSLPGLGAPNGSGMGGGGYMSTASPTSPSLSLSSRTPLKHHKSTSSLDSGKTPKPKGGNTSPDKRLPYVRWTAEEDSKLKKAIAQFGQRWEAVAKAVGTRSYHQCRQRALLMRRKGLDPGGSGGERGGSGQSAGGEGVSNGSGSGSTSAAEGEDGTVGDDAMSSTGEGGEDSRMVSPPA